MHSEFMQLLVNQIIQRGPHGPVGSAQGGLFRGLQGRGEGGGPRSMQTIRGLALWRVISQQHGLTTVKRKAMELVLFRPYRQRNGEARYEIMLTKMVGESLLELLLTIREHHIISKAKQILGK